MRLRALRTSFRLETNEGYFLELKLLGIHTKGVSYSPANFQPNRIILENPRLYEIFSKLRASEPFYGQEGQNFKNRFPISC